VDLLLIRHGLPVRVVGSEGDEPADPHLSPRGVEQAEALAGVLAEEGIDAIWSSPMRRALETAAPASALLGLDVAVDEGLAEYDRHAHSYVPIEELKAAGDLSWADMPENPEEFRSHVVAAIDRVIAAHRSQRVAVVCHGGVINAWAAHTLGIDDPLFFLPHYCSIHRFVASSRGHRSLESLNETAHVRHLL
jgi:2,3-bisphosphoglycerate-dependent phosphoglycerate mutase